MGLNDKNLEVLSAVLKIDKGDLTKALETEIDLDLSDRVVYTKSDYETLEKNIRNEEYHKGKEAGYEMPLKELRKKVTDTYGIETEGVKDFNTLLEKTVEKIKGESSKLLEDVKSKDNEKFISQIEDLKKDNDGLRNTILEKETTFEQQLNELKTANQTSVINNELMKIANSLPFDVPKSILSKGKDAEMNFIKAQQSNFLTLFKANHEAEIVDNKLVIKKDGEIIKNDIKNAEDPERIALDFAKSNYINLKTSEFINRGGSQKYGNELRGMSIEDFNSKMKHEGHHPNSIEYLTYLKEYQEKNK
jgi:hypothetical protein